MKNHQHHHHSQHDHLKHSQHKMNDHKNHDHSSHHGHMIEDFKKRFWISLIVTVPILILSPMIQHFF